MTLGRVNVALFVRSFFDRTLQWRSPSDLKCTEQNLLKAIVIWIWLSEKSISSKLFFGGETFWVFYDFPKSWSLRTELFSCNLCQVWYVVSRMFQDHCKFCVCGVLGQCTKENYNLQYGDMNSKEIAQSAVKWNAIFIVAPGSDLIETVEG